MSGQPHALAALPARREPRYPLLGGFLALRAGLDAVAKRRKSLPLSEMAPRPSDNLITILIQQSRFPECNNTCSLGEEQYTKVYPKVSRLSR